MRALSRVARAAGDVDAQDGVHSAEGAGAVGIGGAVGGDERFAEGGGDVHWAAVVGDHQVGALEERDELAEGGFAAEIEAGDLRGERGVAGAAGDDGLQAEAGFQGFDAGGEMFDGPVFGRPIGAGEQDGEAFAVGDHRADGGTVFVVGGEVEFDGLASAAERRGDGQVSLDGVPLPGDRDAVGIEDPTELACVTRANAHRGLRLP